jgi:PAS domain S-box-containing protein
MIMIDENANGEAGPELQGATQQALPDDLQGHLQESVNRVLADPALAALARAGAPIAAAAGSPAQVIYANPAALALFGVADCAGLTGLLFSPGDEGAGQLSGIAETLAPGAAPRLARVRLPVESLTGTVTLLCRRTPDAHPLFIFSVLGRRGGISRAQPLIAPAPPADLAAPVLLGAPVDEIAPDETVPDEAALVEAASVEAAPVEAAPVEAADEASAEAARAATAASERFLAFEAEIARHFPGLPPARFLWRTDASLVVTEITPPLAEIVGSGCADLIGRDFTEAVRALDLDPRGDLAQALQARATFSRIDLNWPVENVGAVAPVTLGGLPAYDRSQAFEGWRGFGVIHLDRLTEAPIFIAPVREAIAPSVPQASPPVAAPPEFFGVVVPLRPTAGWTPPQAESQQHTEENWGQEPRGNTREEDETPALVALAPHERSAFREIARKLGGRGEEGSFIAAPHVTGEAASDETLSPWPESAKSFADALAVGVAVSRGENTLYANRLLLDWLGFADFAAFERAGGLSPVWKRAPDFRQSERPTLILRPCDGSSFAVDAQLASIPWEGGLADCLTLSRPSVTALQQRVELLESGLRQSEAETDEILSILETAGDGFILVNADGVILGLNGPAEALFGYGRDDIAGENFVDLLDSDSRLASLEDFARRKAGERTGARDVTGRTSQGAAIPVNLIFGGLGPASNGKYCAVIRDRSGMKAAAGAEAAPAGAHADEMEEARDQAQRDSRAKSQFLAKVSHEIRTPLNAILGFTEVIMDERFGPIGNARYKEYLTDIHASGAHVMSLVNDLLDLSKIEAGRLALDFAAVDANRVVSECVAMIQPQANREKVITRLALASRLPAILADERSLRQIVINLLANAVRYNDQGGQVIVSTALSESGHAVLRVKDTGVGMSESELDKAMEPFGQVAPEHAVGGTGLGLPLTKALAEANHAGFTIRSRKNEGTLVEVTFPLAPAAAETAPPAERAG